MADPRAPAVRPPRPERGRTNRGRAPTTTRRLVLACLLWLAGIGAAVAQERPGERVATWRAAFSAIAERHLEVTDAADLALWTLRGLEALEPDLGVERRGPALRLLLRGAPPVEVVAGTTPIAAADTVAALYAEAERRSPALRNAGYAAMARAGFEELFNHLDPYSRYVAAGEAREARERRLGAADLGVTLARGPGNAAVVDGVAPDSPAFRAGIRTGDRLLDADGIAVSGDRLGEALSLLEGVPGSSVVLGFRRGRRAFEVVLTRVAAPPLSVTSEIRDGILWVRIPTFAGATPNQLEAVLRRDGPNAPLGVVVDLRGNRGGLLQQAIQAADAFLTPGIVVITEGRHPDSRRRIASRGGDLAIGKPVVVLVDGRTASAAEVMAAALADRGRAVVVGSATLGKGLIQILVPLPNGAELALSWSRILAPRGWPIQALGVIPSVCTSLGAEATARALAALAQDENVLAVALQRSRAARAPVPASEIAALRNACPPAEGREADVLTARVLLEQPELYLAGLVP
ncbi:S41 family peptidase [Roseomonas sp. CCTCC AB2023176]|uniref:S41 family peptidase n=1 Tax=Roseomonas sp. CCTCC AB2023176 TaxID=3342640 RepID=UPI0035DF3352